MMCVNDVYVDNNYVYVAGSIQSYRIDKSLPTNTVPEVISRSGDFIFSCSLSNHDYFIYCIRLQQHCLLLTSI